MILLLLFFSPPHPFPKPSLTSLKCLLSISGLSPLAGHSIPSSELTSAPGSSVPTCHPVASPGPQMHHHKATRRPHPKLHRPYFKHTLSILPRSEVEVPSCGLQGRSISCRLSLPCVPPSSHVGSFTSHSSQAPIWTFILSGKIALCLHSLPAFL